MPDRPSVETCMVPERDHGRVGGGVVEQRGQEVVGRLWGDAEPGRVAGGEVTDVGGDDDGRTGGDRGGENVAVLGVVGHVRLVFRDLCLGDEASGTPPLKRVGDARERPVDGFRAGLSQLRDVALDEVAPGLVEDAHGSVQLEEAGESVPDEQVAWVASVEDVGVDDGSRDRRPRDGTRRCGRYSSSASSSALRIDSRIAACASSCRSR